MSKNVLGIDIGAGELKLAMWRGSELLRSARVPIPDDMVKDGCVVSYEKMGSFIRELLRKNKIKCKYCALVLPSAHIYLRRVTVPAMTEKQLAVNLPFEFRDYLTEDKEAYFFDYTVNQIIRDKDEHPESMDLTVAAVPKAVIRDYRRMAKLAGMKLRTAIPAELAYANLLHADRKCMEGSCGILDFGHFTTRLHFFGNGCFEMTRVIDTAVGIAQEGGSEQAYNAVAADIRKAINFYVFSSGGNELSHIWCVGGGTHYDELQNTVFAATGITLRSIRELLPKVEGQADLPFVAAAVGAAMQ